MIESPAYEQAIEAINTNVKFTNPIKTVINAFKRLEVNAANLLETIQSFPTQFIEDSL